MELLASLCSITGTSGDESRVLQFLVDYFTNGNKQFRQQPKLFFGPGYQDNFLVVFGQPKVGFFAHMDTVGYMVRYDNHVVPIGGPDGKTGDLLVFNHSGREALCRLVCDEAADLLLVDYPQTLLPGTILTYKDDFHIEKGWIKSPYLDNRLGIWACLQIASEVENVAFGFTTYEEHGGGGAGILARKLFLDYGLTQFLVTDITWSTKGVFPGMGPVVSLRDSRIPRKRFVDSIRQLLDRQDFTYQLEVESVGGSDGREIQNLPFPLDWCFVGPPSEHPHAALEWVKVSDAEAFVKMLSLLAEGFNRLPQI